MVDQVSPTPDHHALMSQLTKQTKHLNATSRKFSVDDLKAWLGRPYNYALLFRVRERFGDYGITGMVIYERVKRNLLVHNFLLSSSVVGGLCPVKVWNKPCSLARVN